MTPEPYVIPLIQSMKEACDVIESLCKEGANIRQDVSLAVLKGRTLPVMWGIKTGFITTIVKF